MTRARRVSMAALALIMTAAGVNHFVNADDYVAIMPAALPAHLELVWISGVAEIAGGLGLLWARTRRAAAWGLILLYVAIFPANVNMAVNQLPLAGREVPPAMLWLRLPVQGLLVYWAWTFTRRPRAGVVSPRP